MTALSTNDLLNRVLVVHNRSLPMYLVDAAPWIRHGGERALETLRQIAHDQKQLVERISVLIVDSGAVLTLGEYPMVFTAYHDVSFEWLLSVLLDRQDKTIAYLQQCAMQLSLAPAAKEVVEEAVGMAKGHRELLAELKPNAIPPLQIAALPGAPLASAH